MAGAPAQRSPLIPRTRGAQLQPSPSGAQPLGPAQDGGSAAAAQTLLPPHLPGLGGPAWGLRLLPSHSALTRSRMRLIPPTTSSLLPRARSHRGAPPPTQPQQPLLSERPRGVAYLRPRGLYMPLSLQSHKPLGYSCQCGAPRRVGVGDPEGRPHPPTPPAPPFVPSFAPELGR